MLAHPMDGIFAFVHRFALLNIFAPNLRFHFPVGWIRVFPAFLLFTHHLKAIQDNRIVSM